MLRHRVRPRQRPTARPIRPPRAASRARAVESVEPAGEERPAPLLEMLSVVDYDARVAEEDPLPVVGPPRVVTSRPRLCPAVLPVIEEPRVSSPWLPALAVVGVLTLLSVGITITLGLLLLGLQEQPSEPSAPPIAAVVEPVHVVEHRPSPDALIEAATARPPAASSEPAVVAPALVEPVSGPVELFFPPDLPVSAVKLHCDDGTTGEATAIGGRALLEAVPDTGCHVRFAGAVPTRFPVEPGDVLRCRFDGLVPIGCSA